MIEWLGSLDEALLWSIFLLCAIIMAIVPFWSKLRKVLKIKFTNQKSEILDFSWRLTPDHLLFKFKDKDYYLQSDGKQFILEGGVIILSWNVVGAYQIDIEPVGSNLKGNTAVITAKKSACKFILVAHTPKGKLRSVLEIDESLFRDLNTFNLSKELHYKQPNQYLQTTSLTKSTWMHGKYKPGKMASLPKVNTATLNAKMPRYNYLKMRKRLHFLNPNGISKAKLKLYLSNQQVVKTYTFHPNKYNEALVNSKEKP